MTFAVLDDHLLRDHLSGQSNTALRRVLRTRQLATTNLYHLRLCKSAVSARGGPLTGSWSVEQRRALAAVLMALPEDIAVVPMRDLTFRMAELADAHPLSALGAEALAAADHLDAPLCVWAGDDGPHIRAAAAAMGIGYRVIER